MLEKKAELMDKENGATVLLKESPEEGIYMLSVVSSDTENENNTIYNLPMPKRSFGFVQAGS